MYVFSRRRRIDPGQLRAALGFSTEIAQRVTQITGVEVQSYLSTLSHDTGTVLWGAAIPDLEALEVAFDKLMAESTYVEAVERADRLFTTPIHDTVSQVVHASSSPTPVPTPSPSSKPPALRVPSRPRWRRGSGSLSGRARPRGSRRCSCRR